MKPTKLVLLVLILLLSSLACVTIMGNPDPEVEFALSPTDTPMPQPTDTPNPLPTDTEAPVIEELTPESANQGLHDYEVTYIEQGCPLNLSQTYQTRRILFSGTQVQVSHNEDLDIYETYELDSGHRYLRYNTVGHAVIVEFTTAGYILEVYGDGEDPHVTSPCGTFTFTLVD